MKISKDLVRKYTLGKCTREERIIVENWLSSDPSDEINDDPTFFDASRDMVWARIHSQITGNNPRISSNYKYQKLLRIGISACLIVGFYLAATFLPNPFENEPKLKIVEAAYTEPLPGIYVSTIDGKPKRISAENYNINFEGVLRIYSDSRKKQNVVCNGMELAIDPEVPYFIVGHQNGGFTRIYDQVVLEDFSNTPFISKSFEVCVKS
ncbi:MAG: hypothetical protein AAFU57_13605 [Bacteroidota bacterium]